MIPAFVKFVDGAVLVGHNVAFDLRMLNAELQRLNMPRVPGEFELKREQICDCVLSVGN